MWALLAGARPLTPYKLSAAQGHCLTGHQREALGKKSCRNQLGAEFAAHMEPPAWEQSYPEAARPAALHGFSASGITE